MLKYLVFWVLLVLALFICIKVFAQQPPPRPLPAAPTGPPAPAAQPSAKPAPEGRVNTVPANRLNRFDRAIAKPHIPEPPRREGGQWRWHPRHGWVWLTGAVPVEVVLPETYVLPAQVVVYEAPAPLLYTVICPHCGHRMTVRIPQ